MIEINLSSFKNTKEISLNAVLCQHKLYFEVSMKSYGYIQENVKWEFHSPK